MAIAVELHPAAVAEAADARVWYAERNEEIGEAFLAQLDRVVARIGEDPASLPLHSHGTRRCSLRRFPYLVVFRERDGLAQVIAVAHARRRSNYWLNRLGD